MVTRGRILLSAAFLSAALGAGLTGGAAFGRLALAMGMPSLASAVMPGGTWRGVAQYRSGNFAAAAASFDDEDATGAFNRGNAHAQAAEYAAALADYEQAQALKPDFADAAVNHAIVAELFAGTKFNEPLIPLNRVEREENIAAAEIGQSGARAQGAGDEANNPGSSFKLHDLKTSGVRRVPRVFDDKYIEASERWLRTLDDQPGIYLKARIKAERKRRAKLRKDAQ